MSKKKVISIADSQAGLRCESISAKQMGGCSGGCTRTGGPVRGLERGPKQKQLLIVKRFVE